jgi:L-ascorbate metabolism protein UlaG (beta-lactamase superfamily)
MHRSALILVAAIALLALTALYFFGAFARKPESLVASKEVPVLERVGSEQIALQLIRHATVVLSTGDRKIVIDPFLAKPGTLPPIPLSSHRVKNPLVPLPVDVKALRDVDALLVTHDHFDHFDRAARDLFSKDTIVFCQPSDREALEAAGFTNVKAVDTRVEWEGLTLSRFEAHHGFGFIGKAMGRSSSFAIRGPAGVVLFTGDTVYDDALEQTLKDADPDVVVANAGAASFLFGRPITLSGEEIERLASRVPKARIVVEHLETVNHCGESRSALKAALQRPALADRINIPSDGEVLMFQRAR